MLTSARNPLSYRCARARGALERGQGHLGTRAGAGG